MTKSEAEKRVRDYLCDWKFWVLIAYAALSFVAFKQWGYSTNLAEEVAKRQATQRSANTAQVAQCYQSVKNAPGVFALTDLITGIANSSITSSTQALKLQPESPLSPIRRRSVARLNAKLETAKSFLAKTRRATPTVKKCDGLASRLDVNPVPFRPKPATKGSS